MNQTEANNLAKEFTKITAISCVAKFMKKGKNHEPTTLKNYQKGVYVFLDDNNCFKVGKVNKKSQARWNSHHYSLDRTTSSTLTKSILTHLSEMKKIFNQSDIENFEKILNEYSLNENNLKKGIEKLDKEKVKELSNKLNLGKWIKNNMDRIEFIIENSHDENNFDTNLLEALIQFSLKPIFEGNTA